MRPVAHAGVQAAIYFVREEGGVRVDCVEIAGTLYEIFFFLCEVGEQVTECSLQGGWIVPIVVPGTAEPANAEVEVALASFDVAG